MGPARCNSGARSPPQLPNFKACLSRGDWAHPLTVKKFFEAFEKWMLASGLIDQLAFLIAKTSTIRALVLWACGAVAIKGLQESSYWETIVASLVTILTGTVTAFISHVRSKYNQQLQEAVGEHTDKFIGPATVAAVEAAVIASSGSSSVS